MKDIAMLQLKTIIDLTRKGYKVYQDVNKPKSDLLALKDNRFFRVCSESAVLTSVDGEMDVDKELVEMLAEYFFLTVWWLESHEDWVKCEPKDSWYHKAESRPSMI